MKATEDKGASSAVLAVNCSGMEAMDWLWIAAGEWEMWEEVSVDGRG